MLRHRLDTPSRVVESGLCIGCGVCSLAFPDKVRMRTRGVDFNEAEQLRELSASDRDLFEQVCPGTGYEEPGKSSPAGDDGHSNWTTGQNAVWGPVLEAYEAWSQDPVIRHRASSGGALSGVLRGLLLAGEVNRVVAVSADSDDPYSNRSVDLASADDVGQAAGSRYSPAAPFQALLNVPSLDKIAVVGKPCDIAALRRLKERKPEALPDIRIYLSFFCAGTPSWRATRQLVQKLGMDPDSVTAVAYRGEGWPGQFRATDSEGRRVTTSYEESWGQVLNKDLHKRCKLCQDSVGMYADIVAADAWEADDEGYPQFEDRDGRSFLLIRSSRGLKALRIVGSHVVTEPGSVGKLDDIQAHQRARRAVAAPRALGYRVGGSAAPRFRGIFSWRLAREKPLASLRQFVGGFRRARAE